MAKRKSFDETNKSIHPTRKKIIDVAFGRDSKNTSVFGYEKEAEAKHEVGDVWEDKDGKAWEQKNGYKINVTKFDEIREYLAKLSKCSSADCTTEKLGIADKKAIRKTGLCLECLGKQEDVLRRDGTYPFYEDYRISRNQLTYVKELKVRFEEALKELSRTLQFVNENGTIEEWTRDVDINKVREDLESDIKGATEAVEALIERKSALEAVLLQMGHPELIKK